MIRPFLLAAALALAATAPAPVLSAPAVSATPDTATVAMAEQVVTNLGMIDAMIYGYSQGVHESQEFSTMTEAQKDRYLAIFKQHVNARRDALTHKLAVNAASHLSREEMASMLALSKIGYLKALFKASAENAPAPDPAMMSADEKALLDKYEDGDFVGRFFEGADINVIGDDIIEIGGDALAEWTREAGIPLP
jgi:hypothetical protein